VIANDAADSTSVLKVKPSVGMARGTSLLVVM
jgi:hypothetical protein